MAQPLLDHMIEGKNSLEEGDQPNALAHFIIATNVAPQDPDAWFLRAKSTTDPAEAAFCLEQVLALNPEHVQAREELITLQLNSLQETARTETVDADSPARTFLGNALANSLANVLNNTRYRILLILVPVLACGVFCSVLAGAMYSSRTGMQTTNMIVGAQSFTATPLWFELPATWTPSPTPRPTRTPTAMPTPGAKIKDNLIVRAGPNGNYGKLGSLTRDSMVVVIGRSEDNQYLAIAYPDPGKVGWVAASFAELNIKGLSELPVIAPPTLTPPPTKRPVVIAATPMPTATAAPSLLTEFVLGRPIEFNSDCTPSWKIGGTVYSNQLGAQRLNGVLVRIWAFGNIQGTVTTGTVNAGLPGYWEWNFSHGTDVNGQVAIVNSDGGLRSQPVTFVLTSKCGGAGAISQINMDFVGTH
jgi:hypothetical protein